MAYPQNNYNKSNYQPKDFMVPLNEEGYKIVREAEGDDCKLSLGLASIFFVQDAKGKPIILKPGLIWKMDQIFGKSNYDSDTENLAFISEVKYEMARKQYGAKDGDLFIMYRSDLWLPGKDKPIRSYGEVNSQNVKGNKHPFALCETRAENRCMRKATKCGFASADDVYSPDDLPQSPSQAINEAQERARAKWKILVKKNRIPRPEQVKMINKCLEPQIAIESSTQLNTQQLEECIDYLKYVVDKNDKQEAIIITEEKKETPPPQPAIEQKKEEVVEAVIVEPEQEEEPDITEDFLKEQEKKDALVQACQGLFKELKWNKKKQTDLLLKSSAKVKTLQEMTVGTLDQLVDYLSGKVNEAKKPVS